MSQAYWFITHLLEPFTLLMLLLGVCVFWPQPAGAPRRRWLKLCYVLTYAYCTPLAAYTSTWLLERPYPKVVSRPERLDAILVLSGGVILPQTPGEPHRLAENSFRRCERAAELYHAGPPCPILISGGVVYARDPGPPICRSMAAFLEQLGVAPSDLLLEDQSRTTEENARLSAPIIRDNGWQRLALVTSATHLFRADRLLRNQEIETIPVGCQYRTEEFEWSVFSFLPRDTALDRHQEAFHEFLGCAYLLVRGKW